MLGRLEHVVTQIRRLVCQVAEARGCWAYLKWRALDNELAELGEGTLLHPLSRQAASCQAAANDAEKKSD